MEGKVIIKKNGPYLIYGKIPLFDDLLDGNQPERPSEQDPVALCRCGQSKNKPYCDGTHIQINWKSE